MERRGEATISERLGAVAQYCLRGARVADVAGDHARLSEYLLLSGIARSVICTDLNDAPVRKALARLAGAVGAEVRQGDGLAPIGPGEVDVVCIAGISGRLTARILGDGATTLSDVSRLIVQPLCHERDLREWLMVNGWRLISETLVEERGRQYDTFVATPGDGEAPYRSGDLEALLELGPFLSARPSAAFGRKWREKLKHLRVVADGRRRSEDLVGADEADALIAAVQTVLDRGRP